MPTAGWDTTTPSGPQHPSHTRGKAQWGLGPSLACAMVLPEQGWGREGGLCHSGDSTCLSWAASAPCGGLAPGLCGCSCLWVAIVHQQRAEECFLDHGHRASWAHTTRKELRPSGRW